MIEKIACKLGRNDEVPNIELAEYLCEHKDIIGIKEIASGLKDKNKAVANDCIKVLYEIGERNPELICDYADDFISCLSSKNNRLVWGGMTALAKIAVRSSRQIYERIDVVLSAYENGSVITIDNSISVFAGLCKANDNYAKTILPMLLKHLQECRPKEVPQHAERAAICFCKKNATDFIEVLEKRMPHLAASQQTRINKLLKTLYSLCQ
jgi:hypothetical protein